MVPGVHPIRAKKAAYYTDRRLASRIMPPPDPAAWIDRDVRPDDWRGLPPIAPDAAMMQALAEHRAKTEGAVESESKGGGTKSGQPDAKGESEAAADVR